MLAAPFAWLALSGTRFVFLFPLVAAPLVARGHDRDTHVGRGGVATASTAAAGAAVAVALLTTLAVANVGPLAARERRPGSASTRAVPEGALAYLDRAGVAGRVFNAFHFGGYIAWRDFPRAPIIDGRACVPRELVGVRLARVYGASRPASPPPTARPRSWTMRASRASRFGGLGADAGLSSSAWALYWDDVARAPPATGWAVRLRDRRDGIAISGRPTARRWHGRSTAVPPSTPSPRRCAHERDTNSDLARTPAGTLALHRRD